MNTILSIFTQIVMSFAALGFVANICIAIGIYSDAKKMEAETPNKLCILTPKLWTVSALFGGIIVLAIYAALHYTKIRNE